MACTWTLTLPHSDHGIPLQLHFAIVDKDWIEPGPADWSGWWEAKARLTGGTFCGVSIPLDRLAPALGQVAFYEDMAAEAWAQAALSPRQQAADERADAA